jgi:enoyl-CoA hydratase
VSAVGYERRGPAALVTIDRPERHNAVDGDTAAALLAAFERFCEEDADVMVLYGAGGRAFGAGADLKAIDTLDADAPGGPMGFSRLASPKPTIAAIDGHCLAGGLELALWCDLRVASPQSTFGCAERRWGVPLIDGGTQRLPRVLGMGRALDLMLTGRTIDAAEALSIGLLTRVADDALDGAQALANEIAAFPQDTVRSDRQAALEGFGLPLADGLALEAELGRERIRTAAEGAKRFQQRR